MFHILLFFCQVLSERSDISFNGRIVGGVSTDISNYPHHISIQYKYCTTCMETFRCGGSIIQDNVILTAAHCVRNTNSSQLKVIAGSNKRTGSGGVTSSVQDIIIHNHYNRSTFHMDIGILFLSERLPINNITIKSIKVAESNPFAGDISTVIGWGAPEIGGKLANILMSVQVPIVSNANCNSDYGNKITDAMLCAGIRGAGGRDACKGDSGGSLMVAGELVGITSWGYGCGNPKYPGVYTSVPRVRKWILNTIAARKK